MAVSSKQTFLDFFLDSKTTLLSKVFVFRQMWVTYEVCDSLKIDEKVAFVDFKNVFCCIEAVFKHSHFYKEAMTSSLKTVIILTFFLILIFILICLFSNYTFEIKPSIF